jgi:hypothetical protein
MNHHHVAGCQLTATSKRLLPAAPAACRLGARVETDHVSKAGALKDAPVLAVFTGLWRPPRAMKDRLRAAVCCRSWCARAL